jgi:hypothetical protein
VNFQTPWNVIGGWVGSTFDPATASTDGFNPLFIVDTVFYAAIVAESTGTVSNIWLVNDGTMAGSGTPVVVFTAANGDTLATATNTVSLFHSAGYGALTLNTNAAVVAEAVYYVVFMFPTTISTVPEIVTSVGSGPQYNNRFGAYTNVVHGQTTITNPVPIGSTPLPMNGNYVIPWFGIS